MLIKTSDKSAARTL